MSRLLTILPEQPADVAAIRAVHTAGFGRAAEADLVDALRAGGWAEISLVAREADRPVGHVLFSRLDAPMRALALAPVAVLPDRQRAGTGSRLIRAGLAMAAGQGWEAIFVLGDPAWYRRFGFSLEAARGYESRYAGNAFMVHILGPSVPATGRIAYPPPFAELE